MTDYTGSLEEESKKKQKKQKTYRQQTHSVHSYYHLIEKLK